MPSKFDHCLWAEKNWIPQYTFPETNILAGPENRPSKKDKTNLIFQPLIFSSYASFRKSIPKLIATKYPVSYIYIYTIIYTIIYNICTHLNQNVHPKVDYIHRLLLDSTGLLGCYTRFQHKTVPPQVD